MPDVLGVARRPDIRNTKRQEHIDYLRRLREKTQHLSFTFRPRGVRMMWMKYAHKKGIKPFDTLGTSADL